MSNQTQARKQRGQNMRAKGLRAKQRRVAQEMVEDVGRVADAFEAERWASWVHGKMWEQRFKAPPTRHLDWALVLGAQVADDIAALGTRAAKGCLHALSWADQGPFGALCEKLVSDLAGVETPDWARRIGDTRLTRAAADCRPDEGKVIVFDVQRRGDPPHSLCAYIDDTRDGLAKHLQLLHPFHELPMAGTREARPDDEGMWFVPTGVRQACGAVRAAIERTDDTEDPPLGELYAENRAMALARIAPYLREGVAVAA
jgi:hypothetical protein